MATQNTKVGIEITDSGSTAKLIKSVKDLHSNLKETKKTASEVKVGGTSSSRKMAAMAAGGANGVMSGQAYGNLRGSAGTTGASARDFANQSQGLGGLVRLYATYAANIFAVSAAFTALSNAMDTSNMVKGLDQLGASSGMALGSLSKRLVQVTDGAISMREAMEATAKASSSGMSSDAIIRMGKVAKQASQALGVDMSDAVSRITRGITKLEPELLDELGIFVRVDSVTKSYAKSVNKAAADVTDFEKRQAFANAVLDQASKKFGEIEIDTNPYTQLLAATKDIGQATLEVVNVALVPMVKLLSSSPLALGSAIAALSVVLAKQAIPAIGEVRESFERSAAAARDAASSRYRDMQKAFVKERTASLQHYDSLAQDAADRFEAASERILSGHSDLSRKVSKLSSAGAAIAGKAIVDIDDKDLAKLQELGNKNTKVAATYRELAAEVQAYRLEDAKYQNERANIDAKREDTLKGLNASANVQRIYQRELAVAQSKEISSNASYTASIRGMSAAWRELNTEIKQARTTQTKKTFDVTEFDATGKKIIKTVTEVTPQMSMLRAGLTRTAGVVGILTGAIGTAMNAFGTWAAFIGLAVAGIGALYSYLANNKAELKEFEQATNRASDATASLHNTIKRLNREPFGEQLTTSSLQARASAILEISDAAKELAHNYASVEKATTGVAKAGNWISSIFGGGIQKEFAKSFGGSIAAALNEAVDPKLVKAARTKIAGILEIDPNASEDNIIDAISELSSSDPKLKQITQTLKILSTEVGIIASKASEFDSALSKTQESAKAVMNQFKISDPIAQLGLDMMDLGAKMGAMFSEPKVALQKLKELAGDTEALNLIDPVQAKLIKDSAPNLNRLSKEYGENAAKVEVAKKEYELAEKALADLQERHKTFNYSAAAIEYDATNSKEVKDMKAAKDALVARENALKKVETSISSVTSQFPNVAATQLVRGANYLISSIEGALSKGSSAFTAAVLAVYGNLPGTAEIKNKLEQQRLDAEASSLRATLDLIDALEKNTLMTRLTSELAEQRKKLAESKPDSVSAKEATSRIEEIEKSQKILTSNKPLAAMKEFRNLLDDSTVKSASMVEDTKASLVYLAKVVGTEQKLSEITDKKAAAALNARIEAMSQESELRKKTSDVVIAGANAELESLNLQQEKNGSLTVEENLRAGALKQLSLGLGMAKEMEDIALRKKQLDALPAKGLSPELAASVAKERSLLASKEQAVLSKYTSDYAKIELNTLLAINKAEAEELAQSQKIAAIRNNTANTSLQLSILTREESLKTLSNLGALKDYEAAQEQASIDRLKVKLETETKLFELKQKEASELADIGRKISTATASGARSEVIDKLKEERDAKTAAFAAERSAILDIEALRLSGIDSSINALDPLISKFNELSASMEAVGGSFGKAFGNVLVTFAEVEKSLDNNNKAIQLYGSNAVKAAKEAEAAQDPDTKNRLLAESVHWKEKENAAIKNTTKVELQGNIARVGAVKQLFKEKTGAYKVLAATEKVMHVTKMAMMIKELLFDGTYTVASVANSATRGAAAIVEAGIDATAAVISAIASLPFPLNIAAGAATAAVVYNLLSSIGGKKGPSISGGFTPTSEQRQETQGTGSTWDSKGNKIETDFGVFGDSSAKANAIENSLEIMKDNSIAGLSYNNKMLKAMQTVADAVTGAAQSVFSVRGLRKGTGFGTEAGSVKSLSGISAVVDSVMSKIPGAAAILSPLLNNKVMNGITQAIFGGKKTVTTDITSAGIKLTGTLDDLANNVAGSISQFKDVTTTTKKSSSLFNKGYTRVVKTQETQSLADSVTSAISDVYKSSKDMFLAVAEQANISADKVTSTLGSMSGSIDIDLMNLTGDEVLTELNAIISTQLNEAAKTLFGHFEVFKKFGEGYLDTAIRVIDSNTKVKQSLSNMGIDIMNLVGMGSYEASESLIKLAGGLNNFVEQADTYANAFLTDQEKLVPVEKAVRAELSRLSLEMNDSRFATAYTKAEFKALVSSLDMTTESGRSAYQSLMDITPGFSSLIEASESAADSVRSTLESTIDGLKSFIDSLVAFKNSLVLGSSSVLTPAEKYAEAKNQLDTVFAGVLAGEKDAQAKFTSSAQAFLDASKTYNASSSAYTTDYLSILEKLTTAELATSTQLTTAELQLNALDTQISILQSINANISILANNGVVTQAFATGGLAQGRALVGEFGPEYVDFKTPGRVYTAEQTAGMFAPTNSVGNNMTAVVAELKDVKNQLVQLRKEQQRQTGDLIMSNYDANQKNAEQVTEAVAESVSASDWGNKTAVKVS